jgi:DsbC/DsbD-like thiol-disulfide interchange protein
LLTGLLVKSTMHFQFFKNRCLPLAAGLIAGLSFTPALAGGDVSPWVRGNLSQVRLISGGFDGKTYHAGVEIRLKGKAHTYWRNPGDGGVPPVFDFAKSQNVKLAKVLFPAPTRSGKPGEEIIGYERVVVFPVHITPANPGKQAVVALELNYAACEKICVPELANLQLRLDPSNKDADLASLISAFAAQVPQSLTKAGAPRLSITVAEAGKSWDVSVTAKSGKITDLFVEAPEGWYFDQTSKAHSGYRLTLAQKPEKPSAIPAVHFTVTSSDGAFEGKRSLP